MLNKFSWGSDWSVLMFLLIIYYGYVLVIYRSSVKGLLTFGKGGHVEDTDHEGDSPQASVQPLQDEVHTFLERAANKKIIKDEIVFGLCRIVQKYNPDENFRESVGQWIRDECNRVCAIHLDEEDLSHVWIS